MKTVVQTALIKIEYDETTGRVTGSVSCTHPEDSEVHQKVEIMLDALRNSLCNVRDVHQNKPASTLQ